MRFSVKIMAQKRRAKRMKKFFSVVAVATFVVMSFSCAAFSQGEATQEGSKTDASVSQVSVPAISAPETLEDEKSFSYGVVVSTGDNTVTIGEYTYDVDTEEEKTQEVTYQVSPNVELENVTALKDIKAGGEVDIEYVEKGGKKEATYIYVYPAEGEE